MFLKVKTDKDGQKGEMILNTTQICYLDGPYAQMSNGFTVYLTPESRKEVDECVMGDIATADPKAAAKTEELLNDLHKLCGGHGNAKPTSDRKARLKSRLKDFTPDDLKLAATNLGNDEFMQGANDNGKRYGTLDYLIRTSANVNKWLEAQPEKKKQGMF